MNNLLLTIYVITTSLHQLGDGDTFDDVCPLLDGTINYLQHIRVDTDLQLTTRNMPETVRRLFSGVH